MSEGGANMLIREQGFKTLVYGEVVYLWFMVVCFEDSKTRIKIGVRVRFHLILLLKSHYSRNCVLDEKILPVLIYS